MGEIISRVAVVVFVFLLGVYAGASRFSKVGCAAFTDVPAPPDTEIETNTFLAHVSLEVDRARTLHPGNAHLLAALMEEVGELAKAYLEAEGSDRVWDEAKQVACVAARIALEGDRDFPVYEIVSIVDEPSEGLFPDSFCPSPPSRAHVLSGIRAGRMAA